MKIKNIDLDQQPMLIAEIGNNHEGSRSLAVEMVSAAAEAGATAVKVQVINPTRLINHADKDRLTQLARFVLPTKVFYELSELAHSKGVLFIASVFDESLMDEMLPAMDAVKIASGDLDHDPLLKKAVMGKKPMILSTGMATIEEIRHAVTIAHGALEKNTKLSDVLALLHCVSLYPSPVTAVNLRAINTLRSEFDLTVGYSDHTLGNEICALALSMGARIIEKHFTLDKKRTTFRDHALSADPADLKRLATLVGSYEAILGDGVKRPSADEIKMAEAARRSIVAIRDLAPGTVISLSDLDFVRPRNGLSPSCVHKFLGRVLKTPIKAHEILLESAVE